MCQGRARQGPGDAVWLPTPALSASVEHVLQRSGAGWFHADTIQGEQPCQQNYDVLFQGWKRKYIHKWSTRRDLLPSWHPLCCLLLQVYGAAYLQKLLEPLLRGVITTPDHISFEVDPTRWDNSTTARKFLTRAISKFLGRILWDSMNTMNRGGSPAKRLSQVVLPREN